MNSSQNDTPAQELARISESARRLGVELNEDEALQWLAAIAAWKASDDVSVDSASGVFGHKLSMLDFSPADLAHFREVGRLVEFHERPDVVETALALSGSAAQSKIQSYPGDCDYFERVNIKAASQQEACDILANLIRDKALSTLKGPTYRLIDVRFGSAPFALTRSSGAVAKGASLSWSPEEIAAGRIEGFNAEGAPVSINWGDVAQEPGWCKVDWVVADPVRGRVANASNMLDVTWEAPDGSIVPLDGFLDPYFQEVYLEAGSLPTFSKLVRHLSADALDHYAEQLQHESAKYLKDPANYGKAAKRMYNLFRLTGRHEEAIFLRELFDEPATALYQVWSLLHTLDEATDPGAEISLDHLLAQTDDLILKVVQTLEGGPEAEIVVMLLRLRDRIAGHKEQQLLDEEAAAARAAVMTLVNDFFYQRLTALPAIQQYIEECRQN